MRKPDKKRDEDSTTQRVGRIVGAFGLRGLVKIEPLTDFLERFAVGQKVRIRGNWVRIETYTMHKGRPLIKLEGVDNADRAEALQWEYLDSEGSPEMEEGEFLVDDLIGLEVVTIGAVSIGRVDEVLDYPAHEVLQVGEVLIPLIKEFVIDVDVPRGVITVKLIPGMLPGEEAL